MIESVFLTVFTFLNMMFEGYVFMFGWNEFVNQIGFPKISYGLAICLCLFISYLRFKDSDIGDRDKKEYIREKAVSNFANNIVYLVMFVIFKLIVV